MDTSLKQRLIGAALLVALAVIFLPMFFDGTDREEPVTLDMDVPPEPEFTFDEPRQQRPAAERRSRAVPPEGRVRPADIAESDAPSPTAPATGAPPTELTRPAAPAPVSEPAPKAARAPASTPTTAAAPPPKDNAQARPADAPNAQVAVAEPPAARPAEKPAAAAAARPPAPAPQANAPAAAQQTGAQSPLTAWAVQVGSFSERENATSLRDELRASGFAAFEERVLSGGEAVFRVKVGPEFNRQRAEDLQAKLRQQENLQGIVVTHPPASDKQVRQGGG